MRCHACGIQFDRPTAWFMRNQECPFCGVDITQEAAELLGIIPTLPPHAARGPQPRGA
jgi:hypothetical protein